MKGWNWKEKFGGKFFEGKFLFGKEFWGNLAQEESLKIIFNSADISKVIEMLLTLFVNYK